MVANKNRFIIIFNLFSYSVRRKLEIRDEVGFGNYQLKVQPTKRACEQAEVSLGL